MTAWNQASLRWRTYRSPKPRVTHGAIGVNPNRFHAILELGARFDECHKCCGMHVCSCNLRAVYDFMISRATPELRQNIGPYEELTKDQLAIIRGYASDGRYEADQRTIRGEP